MFGVNYVMDRKKLVGEVSPYAATSPGEVRRYPLERG